MVIALALSMFVSATPALEAEEKKWHDERVARLTSEDGWLTLVGLHWLEEGENSAGSDPKSTVHLGASAPAQLGTFVRKGKSVEFKPAKGVSVALSRKTAENSTPVLAPFSGGPIKTDASGAPDVLRVGTLQLLVIERGDRLGVRVRDSDAEARKHFAGIETFPVSEAWREEAKFELAPEGKKISIPNVLGQVSDEPLYGTAVFIHDGKEYRLLATKEDDELFFVFADPTNRKTTYGAGRFLYSALPKNGKVVLDFNQAFNPPCAFSAYATCPLPVKENRLPIPVEAGEKRYAGGH